MKKNKYVWIVSCLGLVLVGQNIASAQEKCSGDDPELHRRDQYTFVTDNYVENSTGQWQMFSTCVQNKTEKAMEFRWYVPRHHTWIPPMEAHTRKRYFRADKREAEFLREDTCIRYGARLEKDFARLFAHPSELALIENERDIGCEAIVNQSSLTRGFERDERADFIKRVLNGIEISNSVFAPSSLKNPDATLIKLEARTKIGMKLGSGQIYYQVIDLAISPYNPDTYTGDLSSVRLLSEDAKMNVTLTTIGFDMEAIFAVDTSSPISTYQKVPDTPVIREVEFKVMSAEGMHVATLPIPFVLSSR